ncbi:MAG: A24 family peptidase [Phycisphaerales bacterium]|nr:A24 family peptidase [Phycisphaerales bacterium]
MPEALVATLVWLLGLAVGSFLNVVVYRLPAGLSISRPARSFCPACTNPIAWYDNIPVLGWLLLRGCCRRCRAPISAQYPLIEAATALVFVLVHHLISVAHAPAAAPLEALAPQQIVMLAAWLLLAGAMVACTAMDLLTYTVDTRVTDFAMIGGILIHLFHPASAVAGAPAAVAPVSDAAWSAAAVLMLAASGVMLAVTVWFAPHPPESHQPPAAPHTESKSPAARTAVGGDSARPTAASRASFSPASILVVLALAAMAIWLIAVAIHPTAAPAPPTPSPGTPERISIPAPPASMALFVALAGVFVLLTFAGGQSRESDDSVHDAIEAERGDSRRMVLGELLWLAPILAAGALGWLLVLSSTGVADLWRTALNWQPIGDIRPLSGLATAAVGVIAATAAGWILRIGFTLALGREAFGAGDIYILAAAGACAGWHIAISGLLLAVGLALVGWLVGSLLKRTAVIPFGPWLALGFLAALWLDRPLRAIGEIAADTVAFLAREDPAALWRVSLILMAGAVVAVLAARVLRRLTTRAAD